VDNEYFSLAPNGHRHSGGTILVVEDDVVVCRTLCRLLRREGYAVTYVSEGRQALQSAQSTLPDLVLLDLTLPDMDGLQVCEGLRADSRTARIPIIVLTAREETEDSRQSRSAGASAYVLKPVDAATLLEHVDSHISITHEGGV